jgi:site-specific recombinase XerD
LKEAATIAIKHQFDLKVKSNQKYNEYLKELADLCDIDMKLTTHIARHTFIVYLLNKHIPQETIGKMCGWAEGDARRMLKVYGKLLDETVFIDTKALETEQEKMEREILEILME